MAAGLNFQDYVRADVAAIQRVGALARMFLVEAFPTVQPRIIGELVEACIHWKTWDAEGHIRDFEAMQSQQVTIAEFQPPTQDDYLIGLCAQRDLLEQQIEAAEAAVLELPVEGMGKVVEATMIMPLRSQLASISERITSVQREMERRAGDGQSPKE